jgi:4-hydroxy-3-polyprenylbenzoate decarboxylase
MNTSSPSSSPTSSPRFILAITGASGTRYGRRLLQVLSQQGARVDLILSAAAERVLEAEEGIRVSDPPDPAALVADLGGLGPGEVRAYAPDALGADLASGTTRVDGMVVLPCSLSTVGALAGGCGQTLIHRAADVTLKEGRPLVVAPRETPLSVIHLRNLLRLAEAGACVLPCMPSFSARPVSLEALVDQLVMRVCDQLGLRLDLVARWAGAEADDRQE